MKEKEPIVGSNDYGKDDDSAQVRKQKYKNACKHTTTGAGTVEEARGSDVRCDGIRNDGRNTKASSQQV